MALWKARLLTAMSARILPEVKGGRSNTDNLTAVCNVIA
jgi:hypothetical protein